MNAVAIIPARMASTRLPGKPLADIGGRPMIQWVCERAASAATIGRVIVATCDQEVMDAVAAFGGEAVMTSTEHRSGTDRLAEVAANLDEGIIVNVQGDEPLIDPSSIDKAVRALSSDDSVQMTSLMVRIDRKSAEDPNLVKVVVDAAGRALYFSRSRIPYERDPSSRAAIYGHVGLYAYTRDFLIRFSTLPPTPLEKAESLEQLRALEHGFRIRMVEVDERPLGVDTPEDLARARESIGRCMK